MRKKQLFFVVAILCLLAIGLTGYYWYQKPRQGVAGIAPHYTLSAAQLYNDFSTNETAANKKYLGKILSVAGKVAHIDSSDSTIHILLEGTEMGGVNCTLLLDKNIANALPGEGWKITIKGKCIGFLMDVNLVDAVIESNSNN